MQLPIHAGIKFKPFWLKGSLECEVQIIRAKYRSTDAFTNPEIWALSLTKLNAFVGRRVEIARVCTVALTQRKPPIRSTAKQLEWFTLLVKWQHPIRYQYIIYLGVLSINNWDRFEMDISHGLNSSKWTRRYCHFDKIYFTRNCQTR